jgi:hypothetical protein
VGAGAPRPRSEVDFVTEWWKAHQLIGTGSAEATAKALAWLAEAEAKGSEHRGTQGAPKRDLTLRRLLLLEPMHRRSARIFRALFLIDVVWLLLGSAVTASDAGSRSSRGELGSDIGMLIFFALLGLILRALAVSGDKAAEAPATPSLGVVSPGLPGPDPALGVSGDPLVLTRE